MANVGEAGADEICRLELSPHCEVRWLHAGIPPATMAIYTQEFRATASESSSARLQKAPGQALAGLWPRADPMLSKRTNITLHYLSSTTFTLKSNIFLWSIACRMAWCSVLSACVCFRFGLFWKSCVNIFKFIIRNVSSIWIRETSKMFWGNVLSKAADSLTAWLQNKCGCSWKRAPFSLHIFYLETN